MNNENPKSSKSRPLFCLASECEQLHVAISEANEMLTLLKEYMQREAHAGDFVKDKATAALCFAGKADTMANVLNVASRDLDHSLYALQGLYDELYDLAAHEKDNA